MKRDARAAVRVRIARGQRTAEVERACTLTDAVNPLIIEVATESNRMFR